MKRIAFLLMLIATMLCAGCGPSSADTAALVARDATVSANATATMLEGMQSVALVLYRAEQEIQIQIAVSNGEGKDSAVHRVAVVRKTWEPVWDAFAKARLSYSVLVAVINDKNATQAGIQSAVTEQSRRMTTVTNELSIARSRVQGGIQ